MENDSRIYIPGHESMIGTAILKCLQENGHFNTIVVPSDKLDISNQEKVKEFFKAEKPEYVFMTAGKVGGIVDNSTHPAEFIYYNMIVESNIIHSSWLSGVNKLLFLGSSCAYPRDCPQPMKEEYLLTGKLEPTSEPYAIAKIAGMKMCQAYNAQYKTNYISVIPADVYGPNDDFNPATAHVFPALLARFHAAKHDKDPDIAVWGSGSPKRELFHVDDLAEACIFLMQYYDDTAVINAGCGEDISIKDMAYMIKNIVGFEGSIKFDLSKPDGMPRKLLDIGKLRNMGWTPRISLRQGISGTYEWYLNHQA